MSSMNRAQRRAAKKSEPKKKPEGHNLSARERLANIEKNGITAKELERSFEDGRREAMKIRTNYIMNMFFAANAIALHREFGFGEQRITRVLKRTERIMIEELTTEDITERCRRETGIDIDIEDEGFGEVYKADEGAVK